MLKLLGYSVAIIAVVYGGCVSKPAQKFWADDAAKNIAEQHREETPHVIRDSGDGCKVYAFRADGTHYFTRCSPGETVTTERNYSERVGKANVKKTETIVTN